MRVKVGECTRSVTPRPRAMPLTSCVLPAPRSPVRPTTWPDGASRPHCSPILMVSSGLLEMNVAMNNERPDALLVANGQPGFGGDPADATEAHFGKLFLPGVEQRH